MKFQSLLEAIQQTHAVLQQQAVKAVNRSLTIRNWLIGYYIVEFEQKGLDRAKYGENLLTEISKRIMVKGLSETTLKLSRQFYLTYPHIRQTASDLLQTDFPIRGTLSDDLGKLSIFNTETQIPDINKTSVLPEKLVNHLSFSHFTELIKIDDPLKRSYYELLAIKSNLSVRELKRQINTLSYERTGLSKNKELSLEKITEQANPQEASQAIKDLYVFDFLELPAYQHIAEADLETALLDHLQQFILELGHGFCFEARQQKVLIGDEYFFIDLVFYHRILKCHVLIDLKVEEFNHTNAGQLNTYLNYYKAEVKQKNDQPPVGILLVTNKNKTLVEYATAGMDNKLFVSKYLVQLPSKEQLQQFVEKELKQL